MDAIIPTTGSMNPLVIKDDNHDHHRSHVNNECTDTARDLGLANLGATDRNGEFNANQTNRVGDRVGGQVERLGLHELEAIQRNGDKNVAATQHASDKLQAEVERLGIHNLEATKNGVKDLLIEGLKGDCDIKDKMYQSFRDQMLQAERISAAAQVAAMCNFKDLLIQGNCNTSSLQATAASNAAAAAECCCEVKELIRSSTEKTDTLMQNLERERLRDRNIELKDELTALRFRAGLTPPLVATASL